MNGIRHSPSSPCTGFATGRAAVRYGVGV
jgi:hypothetical protein